jgi:hypothetical protein
MLAFLMENRWDWEHSSDGERVISSGFNHDEMRNRWGAGLRDRKGKVAEAAGNKGTEN